MPSEEKIVAEQSFPDGDIEVQESYLNGELDLVTIVDSRNSTTEKLYGNRTESIRFIFKLKEHKLQLSRIFAVSQSGGHALDMKRTVWGNYKKTYRKRSLLDDSSMTILRFSYPNLRVDTRRIRDRVLNLI